MWKGKITQELRDLYAAYYEKFDGWEPDEYEDLADSIKSMDYDTYVGYIKECLRTGKSMTHVMIPDYGNDDDDY